MEQRNRTLYVILLSSILWSLSTAGLAGQVDFGTYSRLETGVSEGEALAIAGEPDREMYLGSKKKGEENSVKQFLYTPGLKESDPHMTVITIKKGKVIDIERTKIVK